MLNDGKCHFAMENLPVQRAALHGDWDSASEIFKKDPHLMTKQITCRMGETPLVLAIKRNKCDKFIRKLVEAIVKNNPLHYADELFVPTFEKNNPLHYAAMVGNTVAAKLLVKQNPKMTHARNKFGNTPLDLAAWHGKKDTLAYLVTVTPDQIGEEEGSGVYTGVSGGNLITHIINAGFVDVALQVVRKYPNIVVEKNLNKQTALEIIAAKPELFINGSLLEFWERCIYSLIPVTSRKETTQGNSCFTMLNKLSAALWSCVRYLAPPIKKISDTKNKHAESQQLVNHICHTFMQKGDYFEAWVIFVSALNIGVEHGTFEVIKDCISTYPDIVANHEGRELFLAAIKNRQEQVYNLVCQLSGNQVFSEEAASVDKFDDGNALHIAARLAPTHRLNVVTGAPLQMQRELQWFKEIEKNIEPFYRDAKNRDEETARMVFTREHKDLLKDATEWMKDTASSCTVVAALLVTMAFAAAFTVPGGNQDNGKPLFLDKTSFMIFIVADAVSLFSSCTSVLMFLGILTSRFAEDDFLYALPKRLTIGLLSLCLSLAATLIAFSVTLAIVLEDKVTWIAAPLVIATGIPVWLFGLLQFPLLVELITSTYGRSIFHQ